MEALVAVVVLGLVGSGAARSSAEMIAAVDRMHRREAEVRFAFRLLTAVSLWPVDDLDRHIGETAQGPVRLHVGRPTPVLYRIQVTDGDAGGLLVETWLYRRDR